MLSVVTDVPPLVAENTAVPVVFDENVTAVVPVVVGLPKVSCRCTVMGPSVAVAEAVPDTAVEVITSFATVAGLTVTERPAPFEIEPSVTVMDAPRP